ncbi:MAG: hypothetical protein ABI345_11200 [Jatrophihabitans sp.]
MSDPQIERRVSRVENDTEAIYDLITEMRSTLLEHTQRFEKIDQRFEKIDQRFEKIDQRFDKVGQRFDNIDTTLTEVLRRLPGPSGQV